MLRGGGVLIREAPGNRSALPIIPWLVEVAARGTFENAARERASEVGYGSLRWQKLLLLPTERCICSKLELAPIGEETFPVCYSSSILSRDYQMEDVIVQLMANCWRGDWVKPDL